MYMYAWIDVTMYSELLVRETVFLSVHAHPLKWYIIMYTYIAEIGRAHV